MCDPLDPGFPSSPGSDPLHSLLANSENHTACAVEPWLDAWPHASQMASEEAFRGQELGTRSMMPRRPVATTVFARLRFPTIFPTSSALSRKFSFRSRSISAFWDLGYHVLEAWLL